MMNNGLMNPLTSTSTSTSISTTGHNNNNNNNQSTTNINSIKTYFKTPEGRYKLLYEKSHPSGLRHFSHGKTLSQVNK
ncbi:hypothetical protein KSS87_019575 [Heliosperma pusillum]|nr:hypothetical protein KSS87_019575 [Heliosperma pusillum]